MGEPPNVPSRGWVRFPPPRGTVLVPRSGRRSLVAGLSLYGPSRPGIVVLHHGACALALTAGPRLRLGPTTGTLPVEPEAWRALCAAWTELGPVDEVALGVPRQATRTGFVGLLLRRGRTVAFVKLRVDDGAVAAQEQAVLAALGGGLGPVRVPRPLGSAVEGGWSWSATEALPGLPHRPARLDDTAMAALSAGLARSLGSRARPPGTPAGWRPMHGDLAPWNLRRVPGAGPARRRTWLVDWEDVGWGPPGADAVYQRVAVAALRRRGGAGPVAVAPAEAEAAAHWRTVVAARPDDPADGGLNGRILAALGART